MPYKSEKIKLQGLQDRRRKLTDEQKEEIKAIYATGKVGQRPLAKQFGVSRSTIQIIVNPAIAERVRRRNQAHWRDYVNREQLTNSSRNLRKYKQELFLKGELNNNDKEDK